MSEVFIARVPTQDAHTSTVFAPRNDQLMSYATFMSSLGSNSHITQIYFNYPSDNGPIKYHIQKYIDETSGNPGDFCVYVNESRVESILSNNKEELDKYLTAQAIIKKQELKDSAQRAHGSRMVNGGNRTKRSKKTKRSKRVHTSKRK